MNNENSKVIDIQRGREIVKEKKGEKKIEELLNTWFPAGRFGGLYDSPAVREKLTERLEDIFVGGGIQEKMVHFLNEERSFLQGIIFNDSRGIGKEKSIEVILDEWREWINRYREFLVNEIVEESKRPEGATGESAKIFTFPGDKDNKEK